jgi:hypothetical protein
MGSRSCPETTPTQGSLVQALGLGSAGGEPVAAHTLQRFALRCTRKDFQILKRCELEPDFAAPVEQADATINPAASVLSWFFSVSFAVSSFSLFMLSAFSAPLRGVDIVTSR